MQGERQEVRIARANVPELVTKELALACVGGRRRFRLSSNFLPMMGFVPGERHSVEVPPGMDGMLLKLSGDAGAIKVYERQYHNRRHNNPFETVVEVANQRVLDAAIPAYTERVHLTLQHGQIVVRPLANRTFSIRRSMRGCTELDAMVAMTAGVDVRCLADCGFRIDSILEYRPQEARDLTDLTETGALNVLANSSPRVLFNEDITRVNWDRVKGAMADGPPIAVLHVSLQCDDFSKAKGRALKAAATEDLSTSRDLVYDALRMIETIQPASVIVENVPGFAESGEGALLKVKLQRWGYHVQDGKLQAGAFGGLTKRERYYLVASVWPGFEMPQASGSRRQAWASIEDLVGQCRDVSHTTSVQEGLKSGRIRLLRPGDALAPTILKSQGRQTKDSVYIAMPDGRYLLPTLQMQMRLNGIGDDFDLGCVSQAVGSEIVGQSIDVEMHRALAASVHAHISRNVGAHVAVGVSAVPGSPAGMRSPRR
ncbi:DNA cytosine methyltransferase [Ottowia sp.]|uniref:DNA cytosine methyltransferase n=1 Tax=Ottowia sp. TaxID=1898956 RepID=UPI0025F8BB82|nr:DNA cytosine methyltransferase [Ottowia sp.]MBK6616346.1 DNA cytosine methyltransferase [Ottowia sp.]